MDRKERIKTIDKKRWLAGIAAVVIIAGALVVQLSGNERMSGERIQETRFFMDTVVSMQVLAEEPEAKAEQVFAAMKDLSNRADRFYPGSEVYRINEKAGQGPVEVDEDIFAIIQTGKEVGEKTDGLFTIAIAPLMDLWGFGKGMEPGQPAQEDIEEVLPLLDLGGITLYPERNAVEIEEGMQLDLGGIAKGAVVDRGIEVLEELGAKAAFINAGGDIRVYGLKEDGTPWRIGVRDPRRQDRGHLEDYVIEADTGSVVTSGDYERFFMEDGERFHHILDPRTGYPASGLRSVTVVGETCVKADILSTAAFMMEEEALDFLENYSGYEGLIINGDEEILTTSNFK